VADRKRAGGTGGKSQIEGGIPELADFMASVNRITSRLQQVAASPDSDVAISDWVLLRAISDQSPMSMADVARKIGVSRQRVQKQVAALQSASLLIASVGADGKSRQFSLSKTGSTLVGRIEKGFRDDLQLEGEEAAARIHAARMSALRLARAFSPKKGGEEAVS
jgi:biotin operon repressor